MKRTITIIAAMLLISISTFSQIIAGGGQHSLALCTTGTVSAWGWNSFGQLGNGTTTDSPTPIQVNGLTGVKAIAGGIVFAEGFSLALKNDSTVWSWGENNYGQLGNGTTTNSDIPVQVSGLTGIIAIACGGHHALALKNDGTIWGWGYGLDGEFGNGQCQSSNVPIQMDTISGVIAIAAGGDHSLILKNDGTVWASGDNYNGQLGNGTTSSSCTLVQMIMPSNIIAIAGGGGSTIAIKNDGTVWACGINNNGTIGDSTTIQRTTPVQVHGPGNVGYLTNIIKITYCGDNPVAIKNDGTLWSWGDNTYGQIGDGTTSQRWIPVQVNSLTGIYIIAAGPYHNLAVKNDSTVWSWGHNQYGELGDGTTTDRWTPVNVSGLCSVTTGINEINQNNNSIFIYPNPATTLLSIHQSMPTPNEQLIITDIMGTEVYKELLTGIDNTISISTWSAGIYFYEVRSQNASVRGKFVKE